MQHQDVRFFLKFYIIVTKLIQAFDKGRMIIIVRIKDQKCSRLFFTEIL